MRPKYLNRAWLAGAALTGVLLLADVGSAAQYRPAATVTVDSVSRAGIYRIVLPPEFVASCRSTLADVRIIDRNGREAPYVLKTDPEDRFNAGYLAIPDPKIRESDSSNRHSYYMLQYEDRYRIDRLSLVITRPALYKRSAEVSIVSEQGAAYVATISIDPADSVFRLRSIKAGRLLIDVANQDNAPLVISRVATAQSGIYLLTYLEPGHTYRLMAGDPKAGEPEYDLHYFTDSTQLAPVTIGLGAIERGKVAADLTSPPGRSGGKTGLLLLWSLVVVIVLLLLYVSVKLARAVNKKESE
jgi:hypothetical protein